MKLKNSTVADSVPAINELLKLTLPVKTAFKVVKVAKSLQGVLDSYNVVLKQLQEKHSTKKEDGSMETTDVGGVQRIVFENPEDFAKEYLELLEQETEVEFKKIPVDDLGDASVAPATLLNLSWLIDGLED